MMQEKAATPVFRITVAVQQILSPYALRTETLLGSAIPLLLANLALDYGRLNGSFAIWLFISVLGYLAAMSVPVLVRAAIGQRKLPAVFYLLIFVVAGAIRGLVIYLVGRDAGVVPDSELQFRLIGSTIYVLISMSLITLLVASTLRATDALNALEASRLVLEARLNSMRTEISRLNAEVYGRVSGLISPIIQNLISNLKGAKDTEIAREVRALRSTVDEVVRPLSLEVVANSQELSTPTGARRRDLGFENWKIDSKVQVSRQIVSFWAAVLIIVVSTPASFTFYPDHPIESVLVLGVTLGLVLFAAEVALRKVWLPAIVAFVLQMLIYALAGLVASVTLNFVREEGVYSFGRIIMLSMIAGGAMFISQFRETQLAEATAKALEVNRDLELLNSQARRELWLNRRRVATVLHGPVQAALFSSAMRLAQAPKPSKRLVNSVNESLADALEALKFDSLESPKLQTVLAQIVEVWSGNCEIFVSVPKTVFQLCKKNPILSEAMAEVVREAVSNAIKHGSAKEVEIEAHVSDNLIVLTILNNGKSPVNRRGQGFGSKLYSELTHAWSLAKVDDGRTKFSAIIFIA